MQLPVPDVLRICRWRLYLYELFSTGEQATRLWCDNNELRLQHDHNEPAWLQSSRLHMDCLAVGLGAVSDKQMLPCPAR